MTAPREVPDRGPKPSIAHHPDANTLDFAGRRLHFEGRINRVHRFSPPPMNPIAPGTLIANRYQVTRVLGQGGFGRTYLAEDCNRFHEACVLKEFAPQVQGPEALQKAQDLFQREAGVLYRLNHPQIPCFRELLRANHEQRDYLLLVQDYVEGRTYRDILTDRQAQGQRFGQAEVQQLLVQLLPVLTYVHSNGVIHRDISPDNLIWRRADQLPVLIDFGGVKQAAVSIVSQYHDDRNTLGLASENFTRLGKAGYAPPEQMQQGSVYPHSDLYALAVTALVLLTGQEPQVLLDPQTLEWRWRAWVSLSEELGAVLDRMLELRPSDRYPDAATVFHALTGSAVPRSPVFTPAPATPSPAAPPATQATVAAIGRPTPQTTVATAAQGQPTQATPRSAQTATATPPPRRSRDNWGAMVLFVVVLGLAGLGGWGTVRLLQGLQGTNPDGSSPSPTPQPTETLPSEEQRLSEALLKRQRQLKLNEAFFIGLVDQFFFLSYPDLSSQSLSTAPEDAPYREIWNNLAQTWLDRLERLNESQRSRLGQYTGQDFTNWVQEVNDRFLSSRALVELVNAAFAYTFPEVPLSEVPEGPIDQVWWALGEEVKTGIMQGKTLEELAIPAGETQATIEGTVQPGQGKAIIAFLQAGQTFNLDFEAPDSLSLGFYPPSSDQAPLLSPQAGSITWSTELSEEGYYEFVLLPSGDRAVPYSLTIAVDNIPVDPPPSPSPSPTPTLTPTPTPTLTPIKPSPTPPPATPSPLPTPDPDPAPDPDKDQPNTLP